MYLHIMVSVQLRQDSHPFSVTQGHEPFPGDNSGQWTGEETGKSGGNPEAWGEHEYREELGIKSSSLELIYNRRYCRSIQLLTGMLGKRRRR